MFSESEKTSKEAIDAMASFPMYSSKSSLPKSMAKIAAGSIIESLLKEFSNKETHSQMEAKGLNNVRTMCFVECT